MLEGLRVVELATYIAAPGAGVILSDWGAEVIKVESPAGDPARHFLADTAGEDAPNPMFTLDNRGKRSVVLDYGQPAGREALEKLIATADIFLTNVRPGALKRAGLDYDSLKDRYPALVYCSVTGYGLTGDNADKAGFDVAAFWARSGVGAMNRPKGSEPFPIRTGMGDHVCSVTTVAGILAAVVDKLRTGKGRLVETSLLRAGVWAMSADISVQQQFGKLSSTKSRREAVNPLANFFMTADERWLCIVPRTGKGGDWPQVCRVIGRPELIEEPRFANGRERRKHAAEIVELLDAAFAGLTFEEAAARLDAEDVVWDPLQTPRELLEDAQAEAAGCFVEVPGARDGVRSVAAPVRFPGAPHGPKGPAPTKGQHTDEVLRELGVEPATVAA